jgi:hypothetical protein
MFFFGLLIYLVLWPLADRFLIRLVPVINRLPPVAQVPIFYGVAAFFGLLLAFLWGVYAPDSKNRLIALVRTRGAIWFCWLTAAAATIFSVLVKFYWRLPTTPFFWELLIPIGAVSVINGLGIDIPLGRQVKPLVVPPGPEPGPQPQPQLEPGPGPQPEPQPVEPAPAPEEVPPMPQPEPEPEAGPLIDKRYRWQFENREYTATLQTRRALYEQLKSHPRVLDWARWPVEYVSEAITGELRELALQLYRYKHPFNTYQEVSFVLAFVQQTITYTPDPPNQEYPRYPVETLVDEAGDCEDVAILGAAVLKCMGYEVALLFLPGHCALGVAGAQDVPGVSVVHNGVQYYYCEMTAAGWQIGQLPEQYGGAQVVVTPVPPIPSRVVRAADDGAV